MELIFNTCGEFWQSLEGPVIQIHSPHLTKEKAMGSYRTYSIPAKTAALVPEFAVEELPSAELQARFLCLQ